MSTLAHAYQEILVRHTLHGLIHVTHSDGQPGREWVQPTHEKCSQLCLKMPEWHPLSLVILVLLSLRTNQQNWCQRVNKLDNFAQFEIHVGHKLVHSFWHTLSHFVGQRSCFLGDCSPFGNIFYIFLLGAYLDCHDLHQYQMSPTSMQWIQSKVWWNHCNNTSFVVIFCHNIFCTFCSCLLWFCRWEVMDPCRTSTSKCNSFCINSVIKCKKNRITVIHPCRYKVWCSKNEQLW